MSHSKSTHREPWSSPRPPVFSDDAEARAAPPPRPTVEDEEDEDEYNASSHSSPPTSVDVDIKAEPYSTNPLPSGRASLSSVDGRSAAAPDGRGAQYRLPPLALSQFSDPHSDGDDEDDFTFHQHEIPLDDPESQWESEGPPASAAKQHHQQHHHHQHQQQHQQQQQQPRRKPASPTSIAAAAKPYPRSAHRPSTSSARSHLQPQMASRRSTHFYSSRASSASYSEVVPSEKKAPLVLLHITLLFLPGAEEAILRKITPTVLERGLLVEHPRGDYQLLEELIIDSLSLDDALVSAGPDGGGGSGGEHEQDEWEASLGVRRVKAKNQWEIRVYACNGLMTAGAWKRVWSEMERVDVEVGPKGWRGKKTDELIRGFVRSGGRYGSRDGGVGRGKALFPPVTDLKWWVAVVGVVVLAIAASFFGLFWALGLGPGGRGVQNQLIYPPGDHIPAAVASIENVTALPGVAVVEPMEEALVEPMEEALVVDAEDVKSVSDCGKEVSPTTSTTTAATTTAPAAESESTDACGRAIEVTGAEAEAEAVVEAEVEASDDANAEPIFEEEPAGELNSPEISSTLAEAMPVDVTPQPDEATVPATFTALSEATKEPAAPVLLSFDDADGTDSGPEGWWNNWGTGLRV